MTEATILIDLSVLENRPFTGVERYALELAVRLPAHLSGHRLVAALGRAEVADPRLEALELRRGRVLPRALWRRLGLPGLARRLGAGLLFAPVSSVPRSSAFVSLRTVHDLGRPPRLPRPLELPTITPSAATRSALEALAPGWRAPRRVIHHGVDEDFRRLPRRPGGQPVVLVVGRVRARRRPELVAAAAAILAERVPGAEIRWLGPGAEAGSGGPGLRFLGHQPRARLLEEMAAARLLWSPGEVEGFGLPIAEALAAGMPVLAREQPALDEVGGGLVARHGDLPAEALADRLIDLIGTEEPAAEPSRRAWARQFDWDRCARSHAEFMLELLGRSQSRQS
ncbi:MAG: glycosyltransferase [Planctomycetes bacterium]|nr:glycosyltransferase [Planctomycetota bacterium]